ncbi:hypothetical protein ACSNOI_05160 [Actinomadura kijaniata]|uniref:hypothetical protein n=1 Tax=Actinomadura kijaniata TaxID=46161 RepID=UPI003F1CCF33
MPTVLALAASQSPAGRRGCDLATVVAGLTGAAFGWRAAFLLVGAFGLGCLAFTRTCPPACGSCWATSWSRRVWRCSCASRPR